jgi:2-dehydropantoate 2-reductase
MKIAVIGAGAIGSLVAGYLKLKEEEVTLVGHADAVAAIRQNGLAISGVRGNLQVKLEISEQLNHIPDLVILSTKTQDVSQVIKDNFNFLKDSFILTTQNGVRAEEIIAEFIPKENILSSIVMFGATCLEPGKVVHNFEGSWIIGRMFGKADEKTKEISSLLNKAFPTVVSDDLKGMKYLKVFVNANNCLPAILGKSMQEAFQDLAVSATSIAIWKEGLKVINQAGISLTSLPDFPLERLTKLTALPTQEAAKIYSGIMANLSKEPLYGSVLQSIKRKKSSEIDYLNGEFVRLAKENRLNAPLNEKMVEMVHRVEKTDRFFSKEELINETKEFTF